MFLLILDIVTFSYQFLLLCRYTLNYVFLIMLILVVMKLTVKDNSEVFTTDKEMKQSTVHVFPPAKKAELSLSSI